MTGPAFAFRRAERVLLVAVDLACLAVLAVLALAVTVLALGELPRGSARDVVGPVLVGAAVAVGLSTPVRRAGRAAVRRGLRGPRSAPDDVLRAFGEQASRGDDLDEALAGLGEALRRGMSLRRVEIWTGADGRLVSATSLPAAGTSAVSLSAAEVAALSRTRVAGPGWLALWVPRLVAERGDAQLRIVPARAGGALLGLLLVERPATAVPFSEGEDRLLAELGTRLGAVLHNRHLDANLRDALDDLRRANDELRDSRARLVAAADAERRRIERDLHDGAQQQLVSLAVGVRLVRDLIGGDRAGDNLAGDDLAAAGELLAAMGEQITETIGEVRDLAHGIYPALLRSAGLAEALRAAGQRSPLGVTVRAVGVGRHRAELEAAVYFCCLEALQNAAKHAGTAPPADVLVTVEEREDALEFRVRDNGAGFDPAAATSGHGMTNMRDRIGAIGGTLRWDSRPGAGTEVHGAVPLAAGTAGES